jgi:hypothetical protein
MTTAVTAQLDTQGLMDEVRRYLVVVEAFRAEGREPNWWPEPLTCAVGPGLEAGATLRPSIHTRRYR